MRVIKGSTISLFDSVFARSAVVYLAGQVINAAIPLLLLPILTRYLSPTDYGIVGTSIAVIQIFNVILGLNSQGLIGRSFFDGDRSAQMQLVSTNVLMAGMSALLLTLLLSVAGTALGEFTGFPSSWLPLLIPISLGAVVQTIYLSLVQARRESRIFIAIQIAGTLLNLGMSLFLVVVLGLDWRGRMLAIAFGGVSIGLFCLIGLAKRLELLKWRFDREALRKILSFGIPLIPHFIGGWVMSMVARLYLNNMATLADTGLFSVAYNVASPVALVIGAANQAYWPALFEKLSNPGTDRLMLARVLLLGAASLPLLGLLYALAAYFFLPFIVGPAFTSAVDYIVWLSLAFAIQGVYFIFGNFVVYSKKTSLIAWRADFLGGIVMLIACPFLIQLNGPIGAAQATALAFTVSCIGCFTASRMAHPMPWKQALLSFGGATNRL